MDRRMVANSEYASTEVSDIKFCPFCGEEINLPDEPLIKDEKIRKAVRAWAEVNRTKYVWVSTALKGIDITQDSEHLQLTEYKQNITFECEADFKSGNYTIAELCGEEEE